MVIQAFCGPDTEVDPVEVTFSQLLRHVRFDFATAYDPSPFLVEAFRGTTLVGGYLFYGAVPDGRRNSEGVATVAGTFDRLRLYAPYEYFGVDNVEATAPAATTVPEPGTWALLGTGLAGVAAAARRRRRARTA